ncbi:hypothetical protein [Litoribacter populi]|uniref:hypothetical protein n=1 Tax=Litoribacter populi TaxID=2598460 RepID=UPI001180BF20|nr:hypothetical protein [Litoribacter populi]
MFNIDMTAVLISLVLIIAFCIPFYLYSRKSKAQKQELITLLKNKANQLGISVQNADTWRNRYAIGVNDQGNKLLYLENTEENEKLKVVDLSDLQNVDVQKNYLIATGKGNDKIMDMVQLSCYFKGNSNPPVHLEFYNGSKFPSLQNEFELVRKWEDELSRIIEIKTSPKV